jgi:predicted ATPase
MKQYITNLIISGFKGFQRRTSIPFNLLTVLAGANSVGKSTIIQSLLLLRSALKPSTGSIPNIEDRILLNGPFLLSLGNTRQVGSTKNIGFLINFREQSKQLELTFDSLPNLTYFNLRGIRGIEHNNFLMAKNFHYLNAERIGPRPFYENGLNILPSVGFQGEHTISVLVNGYNFETNPDKNFHKVQLSETRSPDILIEQVQYWMQFIIPGINISATNIDSINRSVSTINGHTPANVGFGISYVLPIVVAGLLAEEGCIFIVENPEAHLHPFGQSRIGQFLAMVAASNVQVIVETHSEHVINGMRVAAIKDWLNHQNILINFLHKDSEESPLMVNSIEVDEKGDLSDFPIGFFDQSAQDLISLTKIRREKNEKC